MKFDQQKHRDGSLAYKTKESSICFLGCVQPPIFCVQVRLFCVQLLMFSVQPPRLAATSFSDNLEPDH